MFSGLKRKKVDFLGTALTLFFIMTIFGVLLALTHLFTAPIVERSTEERLQQSLHSLMEEAAEFQEVDEFEPIIVLGNERVPVRAVYNALDPLAESMGYCVRVTPNGYSNMIDMLVAIDRDGAVKSVSILSISETPGIGMKVESDETFQSSVNGLTDTAKIVKTTPTVKEEIPVISGATVSSTAYINGVNAAIEVVQPLRLGVLN